MGLDEVDTHIWEDWEKKMGQILPNDSFTSGTPVAEFFQKVFKLMTYPLGGGGCH